jgi:hypothetical protein
LDFRAKPGLDDFDGQGISQGDFAYFGISEQTSKKKFVRERNAKETPKQVLLLAFPSRSFRGQSSSLYLIWFCFSSMTMLLTQSAIMA